MTFMCEERGAFVDPDSVQIDIDRSLHHKQSHSGYFTTERKSTLALPSSALTFDLWTPVDPDSTRSENVEGDGVQHT